MLTCKYLECDRRKALSEAENNHHKFEYQKLGSNGFATAMKDCKALTNYFTCTLNILDR